MKYSREGQDVLLRGNPNRAQSEVNPRIIRYADVKLLYAEAIVRSGGSIATAIAEVNDIRERARNSADVPALEPADLAAPASADVALDLIFAERRLELFAEEDHRWVDLKRRHLAGEIDLTTWNFDSYLEPASFLPRNINFPFPNGEVIDRALNQNEGY